jgi:hypothetical protein
MAATRNIEKHLHVAVYWAGAEIGTYCKPLKSSRGVTAGKGIMSDIRSVIWPKWDELEIIHRTSSGLFLNPNLSWFGVFFDGSTNHLLNSQQQRRQLLEIKPGTSASLRVEDLSVAIRVGPKFKKDPQNIRPIQGFGAGFLSLFVDRGHEWATMSIGLVASGIIAGAAYMSMKSRAPDNYSSIIELPDHKLLPFISPNYLKNAPELMQFNLDRFNYVHSVWKYYEDYASSVALGVPPDGPTKIFPSTIETYSEFSASAAKTIRDAEERQRQNQYKGISSLSLPVSRGESAVGAVIRTLDKISVTSETSKAQVERRNKVAEEYENEVGYKFTPKEGSTGNKAFAAISAGFMGLESDEKAQVTQAQNLSSKAALIQMNLFGKNRLLFGPVGCCQMPVGAPISHDVFSWSLPETDFVASPPIELASLKASTWGEPVKEVPVIREPKSGKISPSLVERTVAAGRHQVRLCYELSLRRNQVSAGTMEWKWLIDTRGRISQLELVKSSIKDEDLVKCVRQKIASWKFAKPEGGSVEVLYPFEFNRDKG